MPVADPIAPETSDEGLLRRAQGAHNWRSWRDLGQTLTARLVLLAIPVVVAGLVLVVPHVWVGVWVGLLGAVVGVLVTAAILDPPLREGRTLPRKGRTSARLSGRQADVPPPSGELRPLRPRLDVALGTPLGERPGSGGRLGRARAARVARAAKSGRIDITWHESDHYVFRIQLGSPAPSEPSWADVHSLLSAITAGLEPGKWGRDERLRWIADNERGVRIRWVEDVVDGSSRLTP